MKIKIFGKNIFEIKKQDIFTTAARSNLEESKILPNFIGHSREFDFDPDQLYALDSTDVEIMVSEKAREISKKKNKKEEEIRLTPKGIYLMKTLNDDLEINVSKDYIDKQIKIFEEKLKIIKLDENDFGNGIREIESFLIRLENRKKYKEFKDFYDKFAYTTNTKIKKILKANSHLKIGSISQFIADMPNEAVEIMKEYNKETENLCGKKAVFYIIADKKDFKKTEERRDPILLAQSPFGHCWQILGAWDKEMLLLEKL